MGRDEGAMAAFLNVCYRLPPDVCFIISRLYYQDRLLSCHEPKRAKFRVPVVVIDTPVEIWDLNEKTVRMSETEAKVAMEVAEVLNAAGVKSKNLVLYRK